MKQIVVAVQVDDGHARDLSHLTKEMGLDASSVQAKALDGQAVATIVIPVSIATLHVFRTWLLARIDAKKSTLVKVKGRTLRGYSVEEVTMILQALQGHLDSAPDSDERRDH